MSYINLNVDIFKNKHPMFAFNYNTPLNKLAKFNLTISNKGDRHKGNPLCLSPLLLRNISNLTKMYIFSKLGWFL